jgi:hypothetical protein
MTRSRAGRDRSMAPYDPEVDAEVRAELSEPDHADYALITDYLADELSAADRERVEERLRTDAAFRALAEPLIMVWSQPRAIDREPTPADRMEAERAWKKLAARIELEEQRIHSPALEKKRAKQRRRHRTIFGFIFTTLVAGLLEWFHLQHMPIPQPSFLEHTDAPAYEKRFARLPDETQVTLLPGSHLSYSHLFAGSYERTLNLDGEGTFVVAPGPGALVVHGRGVEVRAGQGRFTVQAYDVVPITYVTVQEGHAQVQALTAVGNGENLTLYAGQSARVGPGQRIERVDGAIPAEPTKIDSGGSKTERATLTQDAFVRGPRALADRGLALVEAIGHDFGERPHELAFTGRDTIDITFWNPAFWRSDTRSQEFPQASLPLVRKAASHVGGFVWTSYGRDAGIDVIRVTFVRMRRESSALLTRLVPAQEVTGQLTRKQLEAGPPQLVSLTMTQR